MKRIGSLLLPCLVLAFSSTGCLGLKPARDSTRHLLLSAPETNRPTGAATPPPGLVIGLAPVALPAYLDSPWFAVRQGENEMRYSSTERWGERLDQGVRRVLAAQLGRFLAPARIEARTWAPQAVTWELTVELRHCEVSVDGRVRVEGGWRINRPLSAEAVQRGAQRVEMDGPSPEQDPSGAAATLSRALAEFAGQLSGEILASAR